MSQDKSLLDYCHNQTVRIADIRYIQENKQWTYSISLKICLESCPLVSIKAIHVLQEVWHKGSKESAEIHCCHVVHSDGDLWNPNSHTYSSHGN